MAIAHELFTLDGISYAPGDISFGEGETLEVAVNGLDQGFITNVPLYKPQLTLTARGVTQINLDALQAVELKNKEDLLYNRLELRDINIGGFVIQGAYLAKITPSGFQIVGNRTIFDSVELLYNSPFYR